MTWTDELRRLLRRRKGQPRNDEPGGISCEEAAERLFEWLDNELDPNMEERVGTHLETCARCYPWLVFEQSFREAVSRAAQHHDVPPELRDRIIASLEEDEGMSSS
ncbi:MAG: zf-HC2 domain-containing protein [Gemmatimonadota bacterium]|nr:zf-HC2 domain-containing protein [Gemmatimonadota bacterium]